jgi:hypothetical protein
LLAKIHNQYFSVLEDQSTGQIQAFCEKEFDNPTFFRSKICNKMQCHKHSPCQMTSTLHPMEGKLILALKIDAVCVPELPTSVTATYILNTPHVNDPFIICKYFVILIFIIKYICMYQTTPQSHCDFNTLFARTNSCIHLV